MRAIAVQLLATGVIALLTTACAIARVQQPAPDNLATWSDRPLPPDAALAATAISNQSSCIGDPNRRPIRVLLQDRRTQFTAAFLFAGQTSFGSCFVTTGSGSTSGGSGPLPGPLTAGIAIDENGSGGLGGATARMLGGRVANGAAQVVIELADGRTVFASIGNGYWLAWWPDTSVARRVVAKDPSGAEVGSVEVPK